MGSHWRILANTTELSMCGGDAAFLSNYFDHLFHLWHTYGMVSVGDGNDYGLLDCLELK